jgi:hypothetical protein
MLNDPECNTQPIVILGRGKSVIAGTLETELKRDNVEEIILNGFFPNCDKDDDLKRLKTIGFKELGLHYESDTAITKHLAKFLRQHVDKVNKGERTFIHPNKILFNGGVSKALSIRERIVEVLNSWLSNEDSNEVTIIDNVNFDQAVAIGAAYYGMAKMMNRGMRIRSGAPRSYYVGIEISMPAVPYMPPPLKALCVVPFGMEEGTDAPIEGQEFGVFVGEKAVFRFLSSNTRKHDKIGTILEQWADDEMEELANIETTLICQDLECGSVIPVTLHSFVTEIGTLELWCESLDKKNKWKLEFNIRVDE